VRDASASKRSSFDEPDLSLSELPEALKIAARRPYARLKWARYTPRLMSGVEETGDRTQSERRAAAILIYVGGFVQCAAQVSFAASATVFRERLGFTDAEYGSIFLPQISLATLGAIGAGALAHRLGLRRLLILGTVALAASQAALASSVLLRRPFSFFVVLVGTSLMGLGAGTSAAPMNAYPQLLFPFGRESALVGLHAVNGLGLTAGPLLASALLARDAWFLFPVLLGTVNLALAVASLTVFLPKDLVAQRSASEARPPLPVRTLTLWAFVLMAFLYAQAEGSIASWAVIFLREDRGFSAPGAAAGLALFWTGLTVGRLLVASLVLRFPAEPIWLTLPLLMAATLLSLPLATSKPAALGLFAIAGLTCSGFFPLTIGVASRHFPEHVPWVASMVYAGLALGVGTGPFVMGLLRPYGSLTRLYALCAIYPILAVLLGEFVRRRAPSPNRT
jgi:fucose permease